MKEMPKRDFLMYYAKGEKLFQIVLRISDAPGSLSSVLNVLGARVNLLGTTSYTLNDGTAVYSAFAEALSPRETAESLQRDLNRVKSTLEADVREGDEGLLVDTFHTGISVENHDYIFLNRNGLNGMFHRIVQLFGTGGEVLLYEQGKAMGLNNSRTLVDEIGIDVVREKAAYLAHLLTAQGWGVTKYDSRRGSTVVRIRVDNCLECSGGTTGRKGCDFLRGYFEGTAQVVGGTSLRSDEVQCRLRGDKACVFKIGPE
jgi:predicted hydrocarbon binding protein